MPTFTALPTKIARAYQTGAPDAYGNPPEHHISGGKGHPCRHCLREIPEGAPMLILAHKPFEGEQPYAEIGPIFLCANACERGGGSAELPDILTTSPDYLIKGYSAQDRIVYGTGAVIKTDHMRDRITSIFENPDVAYIHVRSSRNNCYQARVDRDPTE